MKKSAIIISIVALSVISCGQRNEDAGLVLPTERQVEWADAEFGVLLHYDLPCFKGYDQAHPDASIFNPSSLDTDQWVKTVSDMGAKYIVMIAKHGTGFSLWPTEAHECSVKYSPWKDGKGDVLKEFIASCHKYGIKPGFYYCTHCNDYCGMDHHTLVGSMTQEEYNEVMRVQLSEIWGNYGELFEVWFDGGIKPASQGGLDIKPLLEKYQPNAIAFQGPKDYPHLIRWVGNEEGMAPDPCWSTDVGTTAEDGVDRVDGMNGTAEGAVWCPGESDCTLRLNNPNGSNWMYKYGVENQGEMFSVEELMHKYETSVGRNTNMLIGLVIDDRGLIPEADVQRAAEFGREIERRYGSPIARSEGLKGRSMTLKLKDAASVDRCILQEDIRHGERVRKYILKGQTPDGQWITLKEGENIGHKRIIRFAPATLKALRLEVTDDIATPLIRNFSVFAEL